MHVCPAVPEDAFPGFSIAAGPSRFLVIGFNGFWEVIVDDKTHIGFIDPHPECDGSTDDPDGIFKECVLHALSRRGGKPGVVHKRLKTPFTEIRCDLLSLLPAHAVDNPGLVLVPAEELGELDRWVLLCDHPVRQVFPAKTPDKLTGPDKPELLGDILSYLPGLP